MAKAGQSALSAGLLETTISSLPLIARGKVRDIYALGSERLLLVATDRLSAFDVIMSEPIPGKGEILTRMALFWFKTLNGIVADHLTGIDPVTQVADSEIDQVVGRAMVVKRLTALPVEAVVRGYIIGSGWSDYQRTGEVCGVRLPAGLRQADQLPEPIFTPATKAEAGDHDENISLARMADIIGHDMAERVRATSIQLYTRACEFARERGIIIADTKFEFGLDDDGELVLMDEILTPDSSRFWPAQSWQPGGSPPSFDKQFVRDYLEGVPGWNKRAPAPALPDDIVRRTMAKYQEALSLLTGEVL